MKIIIPSKDRACQLHLLIDSLQKNWPNLNLKDCIVPLAYPLDEKCHDGYLLLKQRFPEVTFISEYTIGFYVIIMDFLNRNEYVGFMVDDGVFYRKCILPPYLIEGLLKDDQILCASLRLGFNTTTQNYLTGEQQLPIDEYGINYLKGGINKYRWSNFSPHCNNGYMFSWDCTFWRSEDLKHYLEDKYFDGPRGMEAILSNPAGTRKEYSLNKPYFIVPDQSHYVVNSVNFVQKDPVPCAKYFSYSPKELNDIYLEGNVIDLDDFLSRCDDIQSCHTEIPFNFRRYE